MKSRRQCRRTRGEPPASRRNRMYAPVSPAERGEIMTERTPYQWPEFTIVDPAISGKLTVFPIVDGTVARDYMLLSHAVEKGVARVTEQSKGGHVPIIVIENSGKTALLGIQGEEYVGAKQNRTLNVSVLAGAGKTEIPVTCVEQGRWRYDRGDDFVAGMYESPEIRSDKLRELAKRAKVRGMPMMEKLKADQGAVWGSVGRVLAMHSVSSDSAALHDVYKSGKISKTIDEILDGIELPEGTRGAVVAAGGKMVGADIFEDPEVFAAMWPRLARSYAMTAMRAKGKPPSMEAAETFINQPAGSDWVASPSPGLGEDVRWEGRQFAAASLVWQGRHLHASVFAL